MEISSLFVSFISAAIISVAVGPRSTFQDQIDPRAVPAVGGEENTEYFARPTCKKGFAAGKTSISLLPGGKVGCYNIAKAKAAKKFLTLDMGRTCASCHGASGLYPYTLMSSNLRSQGYTLKPANLLAAFDEHLSQMVVDTPLMMSEAVALSNFLQSIK